MTSNRLPLCTALSLLVLTSLACAQSDEYEIGGPLAGLKLPLLPTEYGEPAGYPGCIDALARQAAGDKPIDPEKSRFTPQGNSAVRQLRPGSPEIYMAYMDKYMAVRSFFDRQSLLKAWEAADLSPSTESYAAPLYWVSRHGWGEPTGKTWAPRPVVRAAIKSPVFQLDAGELPVGLYCVKLVGAVETEYLQEVRKPLYVGMKVNDAVDGSSATYRLRTGYVDEPYSVAEFYFHVPTKRNIRIEMYVDEGSIVPLLVYNIELHDALAGIEVKAVKKRATLFTPEDRDRARALHKDKTTVETVANSRLIHPKPDDAKLTREQRLERDANIWNCFVPLNAQCGGVYGTNHGYSPGLSLGAAGLTLEQLHEQHGSWTPPGAWNNINFAQLNSVLAVNKKLDLKYTLDDLIHHRPLPDPFPFKDDGGGIYTPASPGQTKAQFYSPVGDAVFQRGIQWSQFMNWIAVPSWHYAGNEALGRDAAIMLIRWAYDWPAMDVANSLCTVASVPGGYNRDLHSRQRETNFYNWHWYTEYHTQSVNYDMLYDLIRNNQELADSVARFIPSVKTPEDILAILDAYLLRTTAKRILRYNWHTGEMKIAQLATIQDNREITDPWMEWLFTRTFVYPLPPSGIADLMVTGCDRSGPEYIASTYYAMGESAMPKAMELEPYIRSGGNEKYNLSDASRYPKPVRMCYWPLEISLAGRHFLRIGDVAGPDKGYGYAIDRAAEHFKNGWKWTEDPTFAWLLRYQVGRTDESDEAWQWIEEHAKKVDRAPWLTNPSRAVAQWASILESGRQHDDYRFRRAVYVRTGMGWGHHHDDTLDLQLYAHGLPMTIDGGQRPGYSKPADRQSRMHNLVEVDGLGERDGDWLSHSWTRTLADAAGAQYMHLEASPPNNRKNVKLMRRQVALIDVDEGEGSQPLKPEQLATNAKLPAGVKTANSYVFDVVRVSGGRRHTYAFHAGISDEVTTNASAVTPIEQAGEKDKSYLGRMAGERNAGDAPDHFVATWRMRVENENIGMGEKGMLGVNYDPNGPRKFTRLHLLDVEGQRVLRGSLDCIQWKYQIPMAFIQKRGNEDEPAKPADLESAYAAIIEPYAGEPIIKSIERVAVTGNDADARQAVMLRVQTANGHTDLLFADGRPEQVRRAGDVRIAGEYAYVSKDAQGLRQATLVGGTTLQAPGIAITVAQPQRIAKVESVDYASRTMQLSGDWPMLPANRTFEIGVEGHWATYTAATASAKDGRTAVTVRDGADFYLSRVKEIDPATNTVYCVLGFAQAEGVPSPGIDRHWIASNEDATKFWRADYLGGNRAEAKYGFKLDRPATLEDFGRTQGFRLWEYGAGDTVRQSTMVNLRRIDGGNYELTADTDVTVTVAGKEHHFTSAELKTAGGTIQIKK